jgi:hypothetical protein
MSTQPEPPRPAQDADDTPDSASPVSMSGVEVSQELQKRLHGTENGSLLGLTHFRSLRTTEDPVSLTVIRLYQRVMKACLMGRPGVGVIPVAAQRRMSRAFAFPNRGKTC